MAPSDTMELESKHVSMVDMVDQAFMVDQALSHEA